MRRGERRPRRSPGGGPPSGRRSPPRRRQSTRTLTGSRPAAGQVERGAQQGVEVALVVGHAAGVAASRRAPSGSNGGLVPELERSRRLDVVVAVGDHRRRVRHAGGDEAVDERVAVAASARSASPTSAGDPIGRLPQLAGVGAVARDRLDPQQLGELLRAVASVIGVLWVCLPRAMSISVRNGQHQRDAESDDEDRGRGCQSCPVGLRRSSRSVAGRSERSRGQGEREDEDVHEDDQAAHVQRPPSMMAARSLPCPLDGWTSRARPPAGAELALELLARRPGVRGLRPPRTAAGVTRARVSGRILPALGAALWRSRDGSRAARRWPCWSQTTTRRGRWPRRRRQLPAGRYRSRYLPSRGVDLRQRPRSRGPPGRRAPPRRCRCSPAAGWWRFRPTR